MTLSNAASQPIEDVAAARGGPVWFQLYRDPDWSRTLAMIKRAEAAGSPVLAWTIDSQGGGKRIVHARAPAPRPRLLRHLPHAEPGRPGPGAPRLPGLDHQSRREAHDDHAAARAAPGSTDASPPGTTSSG